MDDRTFLEVARSVRVLGPGERCAAGERVLPPAVAGRDGEIEAYARPWSPVAARSLALWRRGTAARGWPWRPAHAADVLREARTALTMRGRAPSLAGRFGPGAVALLRSQKVIVLDREAGCVMHLLRESHRDDRRLLEGEVAAAAVLPESTLPVIASRLDEPPLYIVQPYRPYAPAGTWRELLPRMGELAGALFGYYHHFGLRPVAARAWVAELAARLRPGLEVAEGQGRATGVGSAAARLVRYCDRLAERCGDPPVQLTRVHGDFIPSHVVAEIGGDSRRLLLVDWSESHEYSVFHDMFYLHFQNYDSDLLPRIETLSAADLPRYFGDGLRVLLDLLAAATGRAVPLEELRLNLMICLLQELDHRLFRLDPRYLPFWQRQAESIPALAGLPR